jgi:hypothetical protein
MADGRSTEPPDWTEVKRLRRSTLRYPVTIVIIAGAVVGLGEHLILHEPHPVLAHLSNADRLDLYKQTAPITGTALGFLVASVAILVSLDPTRKIVGELRRGEAFSLLVVNLLAACLWLLVLTLMAIAGWTCASALGSSNVFMSIFETIAYASIAELLLGGSFFGYVTYKVARYD